MRVPRRRAQPRGRPRSPRRRRDAACVLIVGGAEAADWTPVPCSPTISRLLARASRRTLATGLGPSGCGEKRRKTRHEHSIEPAALRNNRPVTEHDAWVKRDEAVVWHGFTQMAAFAENRPIIVDRAEGHELIDVDGRRYLDAISSLWVTTLGHHVPELDDAIQQQLARGAHSTMLGNGNRVVVELSEALARVVPVDDAALPLRVRRRVGRRAGAQDRVPVLGQPRRARPHDVPGVRRRVPRRHDRRTLGRRRRLRRRRVRPAALPGAARPAFSDPACFDVAARLVARHAAELAAVIVEPSVQAAAGMQLADPEGLAASAPRAVRTTCCSSATRSPPASAAPARCSRPSNAGSAPTSCVSAKD